MKLFFAFSLLFAILFLASFAHAATTCQSSACQCANPEIVTITTSQHIFINPHLGFSDVPVQQQFLRCSLALKNQ